MPSSTVHLAAGTIATAGLTYAVYPQGIAQMSQETFVTLLVVMLVYSILPDIDHKSSKISAFLHLTALFVFAWIFLSDGQTSLRSRILIVFIIFLEVYHQMYAVKHRKHRKFPHTIAFLVLASFVLLVYTQSLFLASIGFVCCGLHLAMDGHLKWM
ncbi:MAG: metal-dependent hydrolase [Candidatus Peribacteria bacterium]|nr:MAG: metal-dependent hydrolase [Candidatus Peribacteria bacterium]